ncbi:hypothetical protein [Nocardia wallacei]|uniref:hypothetical protein n=1 Tax=Nocardia wallacei TaxID=480035 RepID=UPI002456DE5A|nr:hypothetical protein [Nocardia wallacei]
MVTSNPDVEWLVERFFGPGNVIWTADELNAKVRTWLQSWNFYEESEMPYVLPRLDPHSRRWTMYVVPRSSRQAGVVRELLTAFIGPSWARFVRDRSAPHEDDPVDAAVREFCGHDSIFVLEFSGDPDLKKGFWGALQRMRETISSRPPLTWSAPVPLGRLLAEFDLAVAIGDNATSAELLDRLAVSGLSGVNHTYLTVKRLSRLGCHGELLRLPQLKSVVIAMPPAPVRDAILGAVYTSVVMDEVDSGDFHAARDRLVQQAEYVPLLAEGATENFSMPALTVLAIYASAIGDSERLAQLLLIPELRELIAALSSGTSAVETEPSATPPADDGREARSWSELISAIVDGIDVRNLVGEEPWRGWAPASEMDEELASKLGLLDDVAADRAWGVVGGFIESDNYQTPAPLTARCFLDIALANSRFHPRDLAGIVALTEIVLRAAPDLVAYRNLLDDVGAEAARWASADRASVVLDLADLVARAACPDTEARMRLCANILRPLSDVHPHLTQDQLRLARTLDDELGLGLFWGSAATSGENATSLATSVGDLLLYSLDQGVLDRVRAELNELAPNVAVTCSTDLVGNARLKQWSRHADFIVMATRCATHAATGFIRANAKAGATIKVANGSGSASLLNAVYAALKQ